MQPVSVNSQNVNTYPQRQVAANSSYFRTTLVNDVLGKRQKSRSTQKPESKNTNNKRPDFIKNALIAVGVGALATLAIAKRKSISKWFNGEPVQFGFPKLNVYKFNKTFGEDDARKFLASNRGLITPEESTLGFISSIDDPKANLVLGYFKGDTPVAVVAINAKNVDPTLTQYFNSHPDNLVRISW